MPRLAPATRAALVRARQEAELWNHRAIGAAHLLLGLLREAPETVAALRRRGIGPRLLAAEVERDLAPGPCVVTEGRLGLDGGARRALRRAADLARDRGESQVGPGALLEAVLLEGPVACAARSLSQPA